MASYCWFWGTSNFYNFLITYTFAAQTEPALRSKPDVQCVPSEGQEEHTWRVSSQGIYDLRGRAQLRCAKWSPISNRTSFESLIWRDLPTYVVNITEFIPSASKLNSNRTWTQASATHLTSRRGNYFLLGARLFLRFERYCHFHKFPDSSERRVLRTPPCLCVSKASSPSYLRCFR